MGVLRTQGEEAREDVEEVYGSDATRWRAGMADAAYAKEYEAMTKVDRAKQGEQHNACCTYNRICTGACCTRCRACTGTRARTVCPAM